MGRYTARQIREAEARRDELIALTLARLPDWPEGMPPLCDTHIGYLRRLELDGKAARLPERDRLGSPRFVLTEAGQQELMGR